MYAWLRAWTHTKKLDLNVKMCQYNLLFFYEQSISVVHINFAMNIIRLSYNVEFKIEFFVFLFLDDE